MKFSSLINLDTKQEFPEELFWQQSSNNNNNKIEGFKKATNKCPQKICKLGIPGEHAITLVTFLVSLPTCTFVGLGDGLRLFRSFSSLLGGLDLISQQKMFIV